MPFINSLPAGLKPKMPFRLSLNDFPVCRKNRENYFNIIYCCILKYRKILCPSKKEAYIKGRLTFIDLSFLEFSIYVIEKSKELVFDKYRINTWPLKEDLYSGMTMPLITKEYPPFQDINI